MSYRDTATYVEAKYRKHGLNYQRRYPNEPFLAFLGSHYFALSPSERTEIKVLELGVGLGANLWVVAREGFQAYGIDIAPTAVELAKQVLSDWGVSADIRVGNMTKLDFPDNLFDLVYEVFSLTHLPWESHPIVWREVYRSLKLGGRFFSYHPGENSVSLKCGSTMIDHCTVENVVSGFPLADNGMMSFISANEVRRELKEIGFIDVRVDKITRTYNDQRQMMEYLVISAVKPNT